MKKGRILAMFLVLSLGLVASIGCAKSEAEQAVGGKEVEKVEEAKNNVIKIGYTPPTFETADFYGQYRSGLEEQLNSLGIEYELIMRAPAQEDAHDQQLSIVEDFISLEVDYIIMGPTGYESQQASYRKVNEANIPLLITNYSEPFPAEFEAKAMLYTGYKHTDGGQATADFIKENYPKGTKIGIIHGTPVSITFERAAIDIHKANGMEIISEQYADFDRTKAYDAAQRMLTANPEIEILVATSSHMAIGAVEGIEFMNLDRKVDVFGAGAILEELDYLEEGRLKGSWYRDPILMGKTAADSILLHMNGKESEITESFHTPIVMISSVDDILKYINPITYEAVGREMPSK